MYGKPGSGPDDPRNRFPGSLYPVREQACEYGFIGKFSQRFPGLIEHCIDVIALQLAFDSCPGIAGPDIGMIEIVQHLPVQSG